MPSETAVQHPSPDPGQGVFETILVVDDAPVRLDAHLERLARSVSQLYGAELPDLAGLVRERARGGGYGRLRLSLKPGEGGLEPMVIVAPFDPRLIFPGGDFASSLRTLRVDAGPGAHKWNDRALLTRAEARAAPSVPLLVGAGGAVLEASRANVFAVRAGRVLTPPLDSQILPGIAREDTIRAASDREIEVAEEPITREELLRADEVFLTNSLRGVEPVGAIDETAIATAGPVTTALAAALRERWFAGRPG